MIARLLRIPALGPIALLASRAWVHFSYLRTNSDIPFYFQCMKKAHCAGNGFPYPPLALPVLLLPDYLGETFKPFSAAFRMEMLLFDFACIGICIWLAERALRDLLGASERFLFYLFLAWLGMIQHILLYDRIDIAVTFFLLLLVSAHQRNFGFALASWMGALFKLLPGLPAVAVRLAEPKPFPQRLYRACLVSLPCVVTLWWLDSYIFLGLKEQLLGHRGRGLQMESIVATPILLYQTWFPTQRQVWEVVYNAYQVKSALVPAWYLKAAGLLNPLAVLSFLLFLATRPATELRSSTLTTIRCVNFTVLLFISTQQVFSPQFLIWVMPFLALEVALSRSGRIFAQVVGIYLLTWLVFTVGYDLLLAKHKGFVLALAARNLLMVVCTVDAFRVWHREALASK